MAIEQVVRHREQSLILITASVGASTFMTAPWQLVLTWGLGVGLGTGVTALVLGATIVNRWFAKRQRLVMGIITASTATGQLVFLPFLADVAQDHGWQPVVWIAAIAAAAMIPIVFFLLPDNPADIGVAPYGGDERSNPPVAPGNPITSPSPDWAAPRPRAGSGCCSRVSSSAAPAPTG